MSDSDLNTLYNLSMQPLQKVLKEIEHPGDFYSSGTHGTPMPKLTVHGVGVIPFPVPPATARQVIKAAAVRAPYGRGGKTLLDENVRKVWQIDPKKVTIAGTGWESTFTTLLEQVFRDLGCDPAQATAELYKMLIYDEGGFFAAHRDTEKKLGMFGTLIVTLPSAHEGGMLLVRHAGREVKLDLRNDDPGEVRHAAFYADCEHEVLPVQNGYRVCLVYNLAHKPRATRPEPPDNRRASQRALELLERWVTTGKGPQKIVYLLEHKYTQANLSFKGLKGVDKARVAAMREAASGSGCAFHIGLVHIEQSGSAEYSGGYSSNRYRRRYWTDDDDDGESEDADEYEIGEICDYRYYIDHWRDVDDKGIEMGELPLQAGELLPYNALEDEQPDATHFSEASGNEGASFERTYLRAAMVLWPEESADKIYMSGGVKGALTALERIISSTVLPIDQNTRERIACLLDLMDGWNSSEDQSSSLIRLFRLLAKLKDGELILFAGIEMPLQALYDSRLNTTLTTCAGVMSDAQRAEFFGALFRSVAAKQPIASMDLWRALAKKTTKSSRANSAMLKILSDGLRAARPSLQARSAYMRPAGFVETPEEDEEPQSANDPKVSFARFLNAVESTATPSECSELLASIFANTAYFVPESFLIPCLELDVSRALSPELTLKIWQHCAAYLLTRSQSPPPVPATWAQEIVVPGSNRHPVLRELEQFARDPVLQRHEFAVPEDKRRTLQQAIESLNLDMAHVTQRTGRPYRLICTKTRASYERACDRYKRDLTEMRRLLRHPASKQPAASALRGSLSAALAGE